MRKRLPPAAPTAVDRGAAPPEGRATTPPQSEEARPGEPNALKTGCPCPRMPRTDEHTNDPWSADPTFTRALASQTAAAHRGRRSGMTLRGHAAPAAKAGMRLIKGSARVCVASRPPGGVIRITLATCCCQPG